MTTALILAIVAAALAGLGAAAAIEAYRRTRARVKTLEQEIERGKSQFDEVIAEEARIRAVELAQTLALARSHALSVLGDEERRITEERRRDVAERERDATSKLVAALTEAQRTVELRFADWGSDITQLQQGLASELERIGGRQKQMITTAEAKIDVESERLESAFEEHRARLAKVRDDLERAVAEVGTSVTAELEGHAAERKRALQEIAERLRKREQELQQQIESEQGESTQRIATQLQDVERRQLEQVRRVIAREAQHAVEAATTQFDNTIRQAREDAARRLSRELDMSIARSAREAETVLAERVESELRAVESRIQELARRLESLSTRS